MIERYTLAKACGKDTLQNKIRNIEAGGLTIVDVTEGEVAQAGSRSSPYAASYGRTEPGWIIRVEDGSRSYRSIITGEMVTEM